MLVQHSEAYNDSEQFAKETKKHLDYLAKLKLTDRAAVAEKELRSSVQKLKDTRHIIDKVSETGEDESGDPLTLEKTQQLLLSLKESTEFVMERVEATKMHAKLKEAENKKNR